MRADIDPKAPSSPGVCVELHVVEHVPISAVTEDTQTSDLLGADRLGQLAHGGLKLVEPLTESPEFGLKFAEAG